MQKQILVIGGTGTIGKSLIDLLSNGNVNFKALVRGDEKAKRLEAKGVEIVKGELGKWPAVSEALKGTDTIFLLTGTSEQQVDHQNKLIDLAVESGVQKIVKISAVGANSGSTICLANWHGQIEDHLKESGLRYIIIRPHSFMQNIFMQMHTIKENGCFYHSIGETKLPMIDTRDIAQASFECLVRDDLDNKTYSITGPESISYSDMAKSLSEALGREIKYINIPHEAHNRGLKEAGIPIWLADDLTLMNSNWTKNFVHDPTDDFKMISDSQQVDVKRFAKDHADYFVKK